MEISVKIIAHAHTDFSEKFGIPRQSGVCEGLYARIVFEPQYRDPAALRGIDPDIDPARELADHPRLLALLDPATGLTAEEAYYLVHRREIRERDIREAAEKITNAVLSGSRRPTEAAGNAHPASAPIDYRHVPRETREALKKRIRQAAARGERIYPGQ